MIGERPTSILAIAGGADADAVGDLEMGVFQHRHHKILELSVQSTLDPLEKLGNRT